MSENSKIKTLIERLKEKRLDKEMLGSGKENTQLTGLSLAKDCHDDDGEWRRISRPEPKQEPKLEPKLEPELEPKLEPELEPEPEPEALARAARIKGSGLGD